MSQASNTPKIVGAFIVSGILLIGAYFVLAGNQASNVAEASNVTVSTQTDETEGPEVDPEMITQETSEPIAQNIDEQDAPEPEPEAEVAPVTTEQADTIYPVSYTHLRAPRDATLSRMPSSA